MCGILIVIENRENVDFSKPIVKQKSKSQIPTCKLCRVNSKYDDVCNICFSKFKFVKSQQGFAALFCGLQ